MIIKLSYNSPKKKSFLLLFFFLFFLFSSDIVLMFWTIKCTYKKCNKDSYTKIIFCLKLFSDWLRGLSNNDNSSNVNKHFYQILDC